MYSKMSKLSKLVSRFDCPKFDDQEHVYICGVHLCLPKSINMSVIAKYYNLIKKYKFIAASCGRCLPDSITNGVYVLWYHDIEKMYYLTKDGYDEVVSSEFDDVIRVSDQQFSFVNHKHYDVCGYDIIIGNANCNVIEKYEYLIALGFILSSDSMSLEYPGASYYFKYNAQYQVYLLNGETFEGDFTISSSNFGDIEKQLVILEIL